MHDVDLTTAGMPESGPDLAPVSEPTPDSFSGWLSQQPFHSHLTDIQSDLVELHRHVSQGRSKLEEPALITAAELIRLRLLGTHPALAEAALQWIKKLARVLARRSPKHTTTLKAQLATLVHQSAIFVPNAPQGSGE